MKFYTQKEREPRNNEWCLVECEDWIESGYEIAKWIKQDEVWITQQQYVIITDVTGYALLPQ